MKGRRAHEAHGGAVHHGKHHVSHQHQAGSHAEVHHHHLKKGGKARRATGGAVQLKHGGKVHGGKAHHRMDKRARGGRMTPKSPLTGATVREMDYQKHPKDTADEGGEYDLARASGGPITAAVRASGGRLHDPKTWNPGGRRGKLHREMGIPEGQKIPAAKLEAATHSNNPEKRRDAIRAETMKKWNHGGKK